jgi:RsiW-degrading membrane proteinase PrsW (M82 family)
MWTIGLIILSLAPVALLLWYFDHLDKRKEKRKFLWNIFLWGVLAAFVSGLAEYILERFVGDIFGINIINLFILAFIYTALIEEYAKYWVVKKKAFPNIEFDEYYDGIIFAVVASLGFAALENIFYVVEGGVYVGVIRAVLAVPAHALFGGLMGYYFGLAKFEKDKKKEKALFSKGLLLAVFFHGIYDFLLMSESTFALLVIPMVLALYINVRRKIKYLHFLDRIGGVAEPVKWTAWNYIKTGLGLMLFTVGVISMFTVVLYVTNDPAGAEIFEGIDFDPIQTGVFALVMWIISFILVYEKSPKKSKDWLA